MKLVLRPGGRLAGGVYPGGGGDMIGYPVMPPKQRNISEIIGSIKCSLNWVLT